MPRLLKLPMFPLGLVLYPGEQLPLHIFEPRYKEMVTWCLQADHPFGVIFFDDGTMARVGCTARVKKVIERYEDGRMDILVSGEQRFEVLETYRDEAYLTADVELLNESSASPNSDQQQRLITQHMRLLELAGRTVRPSLYQSTQQLSFVIAPNAGLSPQQKQEVLEMASEEERLTFLIGHLETLIPRVEQVEEVRQRIQSNGHFKDFPPENET